MRASRLVSLLLLLQNRGRMTAAELAEELEVSVRTVYRDVEALGAAGVPVYGESGRDGGYALLDGYRTRLTGLTAPEAEALSLAGLPGPAAELGLGSVLAAAELKLEAALPAELRDQSRRIRERFLLDAPGWYREADEAPHLSAVAAAVWQRRSLRVRYRRWQAPQVVERRLEPYGVVLKAGRWYTVAAAGTGGEPRTYRIGQILSLEQLDEEFTPPAGFDLARHWQEHTARLQERLWRGKAEIRISPVGITRLADFAAQAVIDGVRRGIREPDGWCRAVIPIEDLDHAESQLLRLGAEVEVLTPPVLRSRIDATIRSMAMLYC
ncbi:helix-turn-helix transcriptional regulator [Streptomyces sp. NPDC058572]|uniref:helix-turn-helix transcriptional regulator n=1 Tax=Streptomyces sp. NPDC058572 TaxID=3346546 RepID=UPI0036632F68